jgi:hypothetical protein
MHMERLHWGLSRRASIGLRAQLEESIAGLGSTRAPGYSLYATRGHSTKPSPEAGRPM